MTTLKNSVFQLSVTGARAYTFTLLPSVRGAVEYGLRASELESTAALAGWLVADVHADITQLPASWDDITPRPRPRLHGDARDACALYGCATFYRA